MSKHVKDLTGKKFGKLTVLNFSYVKNKCAYWECLCECGNQKTLTRLRDGGTESCGCLVSHKNKGRKGLAKPRLNLDEAIISRLKNRLKNRSLKKNIPFEVSNERLKDLMFSRCHYCLTEPNNTMKITRINGAEAQYSGIDRVDSSKGYTEDNIVPCCKHCNNAKGTRSKQEMYHWAIKLVANLAIEFGNNIENK